eukprot:CAMPEP_0171331430 /NCGR_PEP_ID=MMETSP0878-20121228/2695_1 /TAXON_ID=67004 /ORGANISM="Thalassiosira weissflogii, Strain CCMP1336" /LENGTH=646 /DNA_ID=CAMNT_0011831961 /DNA_START=222 /DNA_END=2162 /DNA_ORIENTATION=+
MATEQQRNEQGGNENVPNAAGGGNVSTGGASALESLNNDLQNVLWSHGVNVMSNAEKIALITKLMNSAPPQINMTTSQDSANVSTMEGDDTLGELPEFENSDGGRGPPLGPGLPPRIDTNPTPRASGSKNPYPYPGTPWTGQSYNNIGTPYGYSIGTPGGSGAGFPPGPTVPMYAGYHDPYGNSYSAEAIKSAVPKLKKDDTDSYLVFARKFRTNLIFNNLGHVTDEKLMKNLLPPRRDMVYQVPRDHPWALAVKDNDRVMAFYNEAIQDDKASIVLEEAKTEEYSDLGLAYKCYQALQNRYLFKCATTEASLKAELHNIKLPKGANPVQLQDSIYAIQAKLRRSGLTCNDGDIMSTAIRALTAEYQPAITNAKLRGELYGTGMTLEMLISTARDMFEMRVLGREQSAEIKREPEIGLATTNPEMKCFKCGKSGHIKKDCPDTSNNQNETGNATTCYLCGRTGHKLAKCWENPENALQRPEGYKPKLSFVEAKKRISEATTKSGERHNNNQTGKTEIQGAMVEIQGAMVECRNEFSCSLVDFGKVTKPPTTDKNATSLLLSNDSIITKRHFECDYPPKSNEFKHPTGTQHQTPTKPDSTLSQLEEDSNDNENKENTITTFTNPKLTKTRTKSDNKNFTQFRSEGGY